MTITESQIRALLDMLASTRDVEVDCDGCLQHLAEFAERELAGRTIPEGLVCIDDHLRNCGECREEFEALKAGLNGEFVQ